MTLRICGAKHRVIPTVYPQVTVAVDAPVAGRRLP